MRPTLAFGPLRAHDKLSNFSRGIFLVVSGLKELKEKKRTVFALVAASVISLVVWGLVVVLNVR
jgi:hypothetical protein